VCETERLLPGAALYDNFAMLHLRNLLLAFLAASGVSAAATATYNVTTDWKNNANPNGVWQYSAGSQLLPWQGALGTGSCYGSLPSTITGGYAQGINFGGACDPAVFKTTGNCPNTTDCLNGDVIIDSQDDGNGAGQGQATLTWTAPAAGTVTFNGAIWYAQSPVQRANSFTLSLGGTTLASGTIAYNSPVGQNRLTPYVLARSTPLNVNAGDRLTLIVFRAPGQAAGSFAGVQLAITETSLSAPTITAAGVVPIYSSSTTIQAGSWISIYGSNFALSNSTWNGDFPTSLGNVSVTVNSKPAYLWFVSPTQLNLQAPNDTATGTVLVAVTTPVGTTSSTVTLSQYGPSLSLLNSKYPAAIVFTSGPGNSGGGYDVIGPNGAFSFPSRPVKVGETVVLYGVGFGPTTPVPAAGQTFSGAAPSVTLPKISIGGVPATVSFGGIVQAGLFQLNIVVPSVSSGDQLLQASVGGLSTQDNVLLTVQ
jgi:uncharacterized protein (TIGR03437 family)